MSVRNKNFVYEKLSFDRARGLKPKLFHPLMKLIYVYTVYYTVPIYVSVYAYECVWVCEFVLLLHKNSDTVVVAYKLTIEERPIL